LKKWKKKCTIQTTDYRTGYHSYTAESAPRCALAPQLVSTPQVLVSVLALWVSTIPTAHPGLSDGACKCACTGDVYCQKVLASVLALGYVFFFTFYLCYDLGFIPDKRQSLMSQFRLGSLQLVSALEVTASQLQSENFLREISVLDL